MTVEYRWHPFHRRRLHARDTGRRDGILLLVDGDPHVSRKVPDWMCDPAICQAMTLGPPLVRVDALSELSEALEPVAGQDSPGIIGLPLEGDHR